MSRLRIPSPLRRFTGGASVLDITGSSIGEVLAELFSIHPDLKQHILAENGELRNFVNLYVNGDNINQLDGMETVLESGADVRIIPAIAGGSENSLPLLYPKEFIRYSRHLHLPEVGVDGQRKLKAAKVLIVGTGGLGSPVALYLTAAGVGTIGLVDFDVVDISNLQRQIIFGVSHEGCSKVQSAKSRLKDLNPHVNVIAHEIPLQSDNALEIIEQYDLIVDGTDNFPTRYLVNDACVLLKKPYVYGSIYRFDGQVSVFNYEGGPCYRCLYPEPPPPHLVPSCAEGGVLGVLPGIIGTLQANEALKIILEIGQPLSGKIMIFEALDSEFTELRVKRNPKCKICGDYPEIKQLIDYVEFCGVPGQLLKKEFADITVRDLAEKFEDQSAFKLIDVREEFELNISQLPGAIHIPTHELPSRLDDFNPEEEVIIFCRTGVRSEQVCEFLANHQFKDVKNLLGGINAWAKEIDQTLPTY
ncbi:MAG: molybdopterin-synthase adenylyltransferase MoeB [Candidatus Marinimicrobia bacterium]|nr:molybdopterin-synthase adenylyltransferase MoeB [Candidatus Neomarinimicrobiota bacterium]